MCFEIQDINNYLLSEKKNFYKELGENLRKIRKGKSISINELSIRTLISVTYISQIEKGEYGMTLIKFISICNALGINPDFILKDFIVINSFNEDILFEKLQESKNLSINIIDFIKCKK